MAAERTVVSQGEKELLERVKGLLHNSAMNLWLEAIEVAKRQEEEVLKPAEAQCYEKAREALLAAVYDQVKGRFRKRELRGYLRTILAPGGIEEFGKKQIEALIEKGKKQDGAPPELERLVPVLEGIKDDPAKLTEFSRRLTSDLLGIVAYKNPGMLERLFTRDEVAMRALRGDVLPDLILQARNNPALKQKIEAAVDQNLTKATKKSLAEKLKGFDWKKLLKLLLSLGIGVGTLTVLAVVAKH